MTRLLNDILRQPEELSRVLTHLTYSERAKLDQAAQLIHDATHIFLSGIGSSWNAALCTTTFFHLRGRPVSLIDAAELCHFTTIPPGSVIIMLSRSGRSVEIVNLLPGAKKAGARIVAITNSPDSPLVREATVSIDLNAGFDHSVSINMYSAMALASTVLAAAVFDDLNSVLRKELDDSLKATGTAIREWRNRCAANEWFQSDASTYFLARGNSIGTCHEARLLWEEAAKAPATAMGTGAFRHGPQEIARTGVRFGLWIDAMRMREEDLAVARDLRKLGNSVFLVGQELPEDAGNLVFQLPSIPPEWQFLIDVIPAQLASEHLSHLRGVNCDELNICSYVVEHEYGLLTEATLGASSDD